MAWMSLAFLMSWTVPDRMYVAAPSTDVHEGVRPGQIGRVVVVHVEREHDQEHPQPAICHIAPMFVTVIGEPGYASSAAFA